MELWRIERTGLDFVIVMFRLWKCDNNRRSLFTGEALRLSIGSLSGDLVITGTAVTGGTSPEVGLPNRCQLRRTLAVVNTLQLPLCPAMSDAGVRMFQPISTLCFVVAVSDRVSLSCTQPDLSLRQLLAGTGSFKVLSGASLPTGKRAPKSRGVDDGKWLWRPIEVR